MTKTYPLALLAALLAAGCSLTLDPSQYAPKSASDCGPSQKVCGYKCVPNDDPATGCGGESCQPCAGGANAIATCGDTGACAIQCNPGFGDCVNGAADGCEAKLNTDTSCGACNRTCLNAATLGPGSCDTVGGFCNPAEWSVGGTPAGIHADASSPFPQPVYYVSDDLGGSLFETDTRLLAPAFLAQGLGKLSCVWGDAARVLVCKDDEPSALLQLIPPFTPGAQTPILQGGLASAGESALVVSRATPYKAWWMTPGGVDFQGIELGTSPPMTTPPYPKDGQLRAIAYDYYMGLYIADDGLGGRIRTKDLGMTFSNLQEVGTGYGVIGAVAAPSDPSAPEVFIAHPGSGSVSRQRWPASMGGGWNVIYQGKAPTSGMRMVADPKGVVWTNASAGTVMEYRRATGEIITHHLGGTPGYVTMTDQQILWTDGPARKIYVVAR